MSDIERTANRKMEETDDFFQLLSDTSDGEDW